MSGAVTLSGEGLRKSFRGSSFSLDVPFIEAPAGTTLAILGPSGSGKSTLLHLLGLLEKPDAGRVMFGDREVTASDRYARLSMAAVFQRPYLFKGSVAQNVEYGLVVRGVAAGERRRLVEAALEKVGLAAYGDRSALALSGGEAQRVSLARALVIEPQVLLLDEPLANLDPLLKRRLTKEFAQIVKDTDVTVLWVTHDQDEAIVAADHVAIIREGRLSVHGSADEVMALPNDEWTAAFLGLAQALEGVVESSEQGLLAIRAGETVVYATGAAQVGERVVFSVRPEDVMLFEPTAQFPASTARNRIAAKVIAVDPRGASTHVILDLCGAGLAAAVSRASVADLGIVPGTDVLAVFKATAVRWRVAHRS